MVEFHPTAVQYRCHLSHGDMPRVLAYEAKRTGNNSLERRLLSISGVSQVKFDIETDGSGYVYFTVAVGKGYEKAPDHVASEIDTYIRSLR